MSSAPQARPPDDDLPGQPDHEPRASRQRPDDARHRAGQATSDAAASEAAGLGAETLALLQASARMGTELVDLLALEGRLAGRSILWLAIVAAALLVVLLGAWFALCAALALFAVVAGLLSPAWAMLAVAGAQLVAAAAFWLAIRSLLDNLTLPQFRGALRDLVAHGSKD